jgi:hypothetical protein
MKQMILNRSDALAVSFAAAAAAVLSRIRTGAAETVREASGAHPQP